MKKNGNENHELTSLPSLNAGGFVISNSSHIIPKKPETQYGMTENELAKIHRCCKEMKKRNRPLPEIFFNLFMLLIGSIISAIPSFYSPTDKNPVCFWIFYLAFPIIAIICFCLALTFFLLEKETDKDASKTIDDLIPEACKKEDLNG